MNAIALDPECGPAYERRGAVYFDLGEKTKARALPKELASSLPSIEAIETELSRNPEKKK